MKKNSHLPAFAFLFTVILFGIILIYILVGVADSQWYGFGVDSIGQIYIGKPTQIEVYRDGELTTSIEIPQNRTYYFTVQDNDTILLSTSLNVYVLGLSGKELSRERDERCATYNKLQWQREVVAKSGECYYYRNIWGRRTIENDSGEIVYQSPLKNQMGYIACIIILAIVFAITLVHILRGFVKK